MLTHANIWQALDRLAADNGLSTSGLARKAGLDPTAFNPSKRQTSEGKLRWPSTESVAKVLTATNTPLKRFMGMIHGGEDAGPSITASQIRRLPVIGYAQAGHSGFFDDAGFPAGNGWDEVEFPDVADPNAYVLEVSGISMEPIYRDGDLIIISPAASIRRGDRVVVRLNSGEVMAKLLSRMTANKVELSSFNPEFPPRGLGRDEVQWMARIIWASQ